MENIENIENIKTLKTKTCLTCRLVKYVGEFYVAKGKNGKTYIRNKCKSCINIERKIREDRKKILTEKENILTDQDISILKMIIQKYKDSKYSNIQIKIEKESINDLLNNNYKKINKTYSIYAEIAKLIEDYCEDKKLYLSDFIMVSAIEYIKNNINKDGLHNQ